MCICVYVCLSDDVSAHISKLHGYLLGLSRHKQEANGQYFRRPLVLAIGDSNVEITITEIYTGNSC